jgi:osmotically-inducible protein OsmY
MANQQDQAMVAAVQRALYDYDPLRTSRHLIEIQARDGVVTLTGVVASYALRRMAAEMALTVPGVQEVRNDLFCDPGLEEAVALALAQDPRTREVSPAIRARSFAGLVELMGEVPSEEVASTVLEVARGVAGVREVRNYLNVTALEKLAA